MLKEYNKGWNDGYYKALNITSWIVVFLIVLAALSFCFNPNYTDVLGQSICDVNYGEGKTTFRGVEQVQSSVFFRDIDTNVKCKEVIQQEKKPFDGIYSVKIK